MPIIPVRDLAKGGIVRDQNPLSMPLPAWSNGRNVVFENGKALRSPIWRTVKDGLTNAAGSHPRFIVGLTPSSGYDQLVVARDDGSLAIVTNGVIAEASESGFTARPASNQPWTSCMLGDVLYINRADAVPRVLLPGATQFVAMANWPATWRCQVLRQFQDQVMALGITEGSTNIPSQINISDIAYFGQVPDSWDSTDPTKLAYSNDLAELDGPIVDGLTLGDRFLFYTAHQTWEMRAGGSFYFSFRKLFSNSGVMGANCIVEVAGLHYVFGYTDLYVTDGQTKQSLAEGKVREWMYRTLNKQQAYRCFAQFLPQTNEVLFAHVSGDPDTAWKLPTACNNGVTFNITSQTFSVVDLPNVGAMTLCNVNTGLTWGTAKGVTWANVGGSWYDQRDGFALHAIAINQPLNTAGSVGAIDGSGMILGYDFIDRGQLTAPADISCAAPSYVQRIGIALDDPNDGGAPLSYSKRIRAIFPEVTVSRPLVLTVDFGASMTPSGLVDWQPTTTFDPIAEYRVETTDVNCLDIAGRFLAVTFTFQPMADTEIAGFDIDVVSNGTR